MGAYTSHNLINENTTEKLDLPKFYLNQYFFYIVEKFMKYKKVNIKIPLYKYNINNKNMLPCLKDKIFIYHLTFFF